MAGLNASEAVEYFKTYYGIDVERDYLVPMKETGGHNLKSICYGNTSCFLPVDSEVRNVYFKYVVPSRGRMVAGTYVGDSSSVRLNADDELRVGALVIDRLRQDGLVHIHYNSLNPERVEEVQVNHEDMSKGVHKRTKRSFEYGLFSPTLGYGRAVGLVLSADIRDAGYETSGTSLFLFDDIFHDFQLYSPEVTFGAAATQESLAKDMFYMDTRADGRLVGFTPLGEKVMPLTSHYFLTHEGGVKDMRRWLKETDPEIMQRRVDFANLLKERFGINIPEFDANLAEFADNAVSGIVAYAANHDSDLRVTSMGHERFAEYLTTARLIEMGFMHASSFGVIKQGVYIVEHPSDAFPAATKFNFQTITPSTVNVFGHAVIHEEISFQDESMETVRGVYEALSVQHVKSHDKQWDIVGTFKFPKLFD